MSADREGRPLKPIGEHYQDLLRYAQSLPRRRPGPPVPDTQDDPPEEVDDGTE